MAAQIDQAIASLPIQPGDVVDLHLIGHSRGGDVVSLAAGLLDRSAPPLGGGFLELTLLDPHPARNGPSPITARRPAPSARWRGRSFWRSRPRPTTRRW